MATGFAQTSTPKSTDNSSTKGANTGQTDSRDKAHGEGTYGAGSISSANSGTAPTEMKTHKKKSSKKMKNGDSLSPSKDSTMTPQSGSTTPQ